MARVKILSRTFPAYHPRAGQPTNFVEKFWKSVGYPSYMEGGNFLDMRLNYLAQEKEWTPKHHTIRAGSRWKVGDKFSPRVWSGKPYNSKQIVIAPDTEVVKEWKFVIEVDKDYICVLIDGEPFHEENMTMETNNTGMKFLSKNDGLEFPDLRAWFKWGKPFDGQIICWNKDVNY